MAENKVQFNLKNAHYAKKTETGYSTPVAIPGSVNLNLSPVGDITPFYADGVVYYQAVANNGYSGDFEIAKVPAQMLQDIWGYTLTDTDMVMVENAFVEPSQFALLFEIDGDQAPTHYVIYDVTAQRPAIASQTNEASKTPQTQTLTLSSAPRENGDVFAMTTATTPEETVSGWYDEVYTRE